MSEFVRARSCEQKEQRMAEIKSAADGLFAARPYHQITLTTIAQRLSWTRANLYKYVTSKEEIFLELCWDKMALYFGALKAAIPPGCGYSPEVWAQVWTGILAAHRDYLRYCDILSTIIETNVTVERLAVFKGNYYRGAEELTGLLCQAFPLSPRDAYGLFLAVHYHGVGLCSACHENPLVEQALERAGVHPDPIDFREEMRRFILRNLLGYLSESERQKA